jgi:hypothetical protein
LPSWDDGSADGTPEPTPSDLRSIEITYRLSDRFGDDRLGDPNVAHVQHIHAEIEGRTDDEEGQVPLGF